MKMLPRKVNSIAIATHTPVSPYIGAKIAANDRRIAHMLVRFMTDGFSVSPAPTNMP